MMLPMDAHIQRLGFDHWADNKFINAIEDFVEGEKGSASVDSEDFRINVWWDAASVCCSLSAYAEGRWQHYAKEVKR